MFLTLVEVLLLFFTPTFGGSSSGESLTPKDVSLSKSLSWLLRHGAIDEGLKVSDDGFIQLEDVLQHRLFARRCTPADIRRVVNLSKNRFTLRANPVTGIYEIRANSGHTFKDQNNQEGQKAGGKSEVKLNRGRTIPQPGLRTGKTNKNHQPQKHKVDDLLKNYNIPVGNIASDENNKRRGKTNFYDSLMKYPELKKALLWILRYGSEKEGLTVKRHGYVPVDEILTHPYFKNKCMREDIITVANNEPHNFKLRESPSTHQLYIRARKEHPIKQEQEDWSVIPDVIYLPLGFVIHGINGSDWDFVSEHGLKVPKSGYLYCSPYYAADSWHTRGVTKYDDIYIYINCYAAMQDGVEFFLTPEYSVATKGDKDRFIRTQYFKKVIDAKTGTSKFSPKDLEKIFKKYGEIFKVQKQQIKPFAFIQFVDKDSVEKALAARVFAGGKRLFVHRYDDNRNKPCNQEENKEKSRKLSETLSNTSQVEEDTGKGHQGLGVKELPVKIAEPDWCSQEDVVLWQAQDFVSQVELSDEMYQSLNEVKSDVENLFKPVMPGCQVVVFGSCGSTLAFRNSDVDLFLQSAGGEQPKDFVRREAKEMFRSRLFKVIARIPSARVPIVKFEHLRTGWQGDLTANSQLGVCNSQLIRFLVSLDPRIKPLVMVIKYWGKVCGVSGSNTRFTTYSLVMLVMFYLQQLDPPVLPTIAQLQQMSQHKQYSLGWECSFCDEEWRVQSECLPQPNNLSLRELLTGFFRFYHNFDFSNVICPLLGKTIPVKDFESDDGSDLPDEMFLYRENLKKDPKCKFRTNVNFKVQDPFELCLNITRNVAERTCSVFKEACKVSLELCEKDEDAVLLRSLFSIDEESLDILEDSVKININFKEENSDLSEASESSFSQWYQLTTDSIILVLKQIFKFSVDPYSGEVSSKVKKLESSQDVHTPINNHNSNKLVFVCSGKADVWNSRKKMSRFMNSIKIALNPFEREVCISNALYHPSDNNSFYFTLTISSLEDLEKGGKGIEVQVNMKKFRHPLVKGFIQSMKNDFRCFVLKARAFINTVKSSSPLTELKESLKELFELKLENLPDLKELKKKKNELLSGKEKEDKVIEKQNVLVRFLSKGDGSAEGSIDNESKTALGFSGTSDKKSPEQKGGSGDKKIPEQTDEQISLTVGKPTSENVENDVVKCVPSSKNMPSVETRMMINECSEFFKPTSPNQITDLKKAIISSESTEVDKFSDLLNVIQKIETQSTFTSDKVNPFLASIEKVALKPLNLESKTDKRDETEVKSAESEAQNVENPEKLKIINEEKDAENVETPQEQEYVETPQEQEYKSKESNNNGEVNVDAYKKSEANVKNESNKDKTSTKDENLPSSSQEKTDENKFEKEAFRDKFINNQKVDTKLCLQRPKIHSERPLKQKKPNTNRFNRNAAPQLNQSRNGSQWQPWAGGGPPGCQPWQSQPRQSQPQLHLPASHNSHYHQDYQGNYHRGGGRHHPSNRNIQRQKKCYPGLFRDGNY